MCARNFFCARKYVYVRGLVRARVFVRIVCSYAYARMRDVLSLSLSLLQNLSHVSLKRHRLYRPEYSRLGHKGRPTSWHWARFFWNSVTICRFDAPQLPQRKQRLFTPLIPTPTHFSDIALSTLGVPGQHYKVAYRNCSLGRSAVRNKHSIYYL